MLLSPVHVFLDSLPRVRASTVRISIDVINLFIRCSKKNFVNYNGLLEFEDEYPLRIE